VTYRAFDTNTWQDPWFERLSPNAKLLFIYLWTNNTCNQAGCYRISRRRIEFELGFPVEDVIREMELKVKWFEDLDIVWVKNFFKRQCVNKKFAVAAAKCIAALPAEVQAQFCLYNQKILDQNCIDLESFGIDTSKISHAEDSDTLRVGYKPADDTHSIPNGKGIDTVSIGYREGIDTHSIPTPYQNRSEQNRTENKYNADSGAPKPTGEPAPAEEKPPPGGGERVYLTRKKKKLKGTKLELFEEFWNTFDWKQGKAAAADAWLELPNPEAVFDRILEGARRYVDHRKELLKRGLTPKWAEGWLRERRWEDELPDLPAKGDPDGLEVWAKKHGLVKVGGEWKKPGKKGT